MGLSGEQREEFCNALVDAFPTYAKLKQMLSFKLNESLEKIAASSSDLSGVAFELIKWAESKGRLEELIRGAYKQNSGNLKLKEFCKKKELIDIFILNNFFYKNRDIILRAYQSSQPSRNTEVLTDNDKKKKPQNPEELINSLSFPRQIERFVVFLDSLLEEYLQITKSLKEWLKIYCHDHQQIIKELKEEQNQRERECSPGLFIAISKIEGSYVPELKGRRNSVKALLYTASNIV